MAKRKKKPVEISMDIDLAVQTTKGSLKQKPLVLHPKRYKQTPYYTNDMCPKRTVMENLAWRIKWHELALKDKGVQRDMKQAAFDDVLFWFNAFCWCFEPRATEKIKPFCTWGHQDPAIITMDEALTASEYTEKPIDVVLDKSRGQGATWIFLMIFLRRWLRDPMFSAGLVSKNEKAVDSLIDQSTLMWKIVWMLGMLPYWMMPKGFDIRKHRNLSDHTLLNPEIESTIVGYAATGDVDRGGRKTVFGMDELGAFKPGEDESAMNNTMHITNCRFLISTHVRNSGSYYDSVTQDSNALKIILDWTENPTCNNKLYRVINDTIIEADPRIGNRLGAAEYVTISKQHERLRLRGYKIEDKLRNTWYNDQCLRPNSTPQGIARELDRNPEGSVSQVFQPATLSFAVKEFARDPLIRGNLIFDTETAKVRVPYINETEMGALKLWVRPGLNGMMPPGVYKLGADISTGSAGDYSSNSVASVFNAMTGEQVCEWTSNSTIPARFAYVCAALGYWFDEAEIIPEANFAGLMIKTLVETIRYPNVFMRGTEIVGLDIKTQKPGFWMADDDARLALFEGMQEAIAESRCIPRSLSMLKECPEYKWDKGKIIHSAAKRTEDGASQGKAHGDRVIAAVLAWKLCTQGFLDNTDEEDLPITPPEGCMAERLQIYDAPVGDEDGFSVDNLGMVPVDCGFRDPWG